MRRNPLDLEVNDGDREHTPDIEGRNPLPRHVGEGYRPRAKVVLAEQLGQDYRSKVVERSASGDAQHRPVRPPCRRWCVTPADGRRVPRQSLFGKCARPGGVRFGGRWIAVIVAGEIGDEVACGPADAVEAGIVEHAAQAVGGGKVEALDRDLVVITRQGAVPQERLRLVKRLIRIAREHPLVKALDRGQRRAVAEHDVEELETFDMPPEDNKAQRQRGRQDQPDRTP